MHVYGQRPCGQALYAGSGYMEEFYAWLLAPKVVLQLFEF